MHFDAPTPLLGGLSPATFMRRHWHKKPLLIRQAVPDMQPLLSRTALFELAAQADVESRLIVRQAAPAPRKGKGQAAAQAGDDWQLHRGPFKRQALPKLSAPDWTLLVQGVDLHHDGVRALLEQFRFVGDARLDDVMISYASPGGGVGPHVDSYDVFLLQASGRRRWRISHQQDLSLQAGKPLKILQHFEPEQEWVLEPGDMLYLPPQWAHDGVAESADCMTYSVGFRAPTDVELVQEILLRLGEFAADDEDRARRYADPKAQPAAEPAALPPAMLDFAAKALQRVAGDPQLLARALGEVLTDLKPSVNFDGDAVSDLGWQPGQGLALDRRTRMLHDHRHVFVNGEAFVVGGRDGRLLRRLADTRHLGVRDAAALSEGAQAVMAEWLDMGWLHVRDTE
ncbi:cupin [Comamonas serinivorans]|uniref:Cupin n=1 Tax=Comamonas serinivorans TaxID=1082851 RepID=A0A1Y0ER37_9BURK|nr:cupin domain-containing protein [Comamonas serinivorans]ARU05861.1 cupin [Comamonas serinivorans]